MNRYKQIFFVASLGLACMSSSVFGMKNLFAAPPTLLEKAQEQAAQAESQAIVARDSTKKHLSKLALLFNQTVFDTNDDLIVPESDDESDEESVSSSRLPVSSSPVPANSDTLALTNKQAKKILRSAKKAYIHAIESARRAKATKASVDTFQEPIATPARAQRAKLLSKAEATTSPLKSCFKKIVCCCSEKLQDQEPMNKCDACKNVVKYVGIAFVLVFCLTNPSVWS